MNLSKSSIRSLPPKNWKVQEGLIAHPIVREKVDKPIKVGKPIAQVGKRTKERIKLYGTETELHDKVWESQEHNCQICWKYIQERMPWCFAHRLSKGQYKKYRYMPENISLVCSPQCHIEVDRIYQWKTEDHINMRSNFIGILDEVLFQTAYKELG